MICIAVAAAAVSVFLVGRADAGEKGSLAIVEVNGREVKRVALGEGQKKRTFEVDGVDGHSVFEVEDGRIRMVSSACRDKLCVGVGPIDSGGRAIVCLPNRVVIRVTGVSRGAGGVDGVTE